MFNYSNNGITVASILDERRETKKNTFPIKIRVTFKRERTYYSTGKKLTIDEWELLPNSKIKVHVNIRENIQNSFDKVKRLVQDLEYNDNFSLESLNKLLGKAMSDTVNTAFHAKMNELLENEQVGSYDYYKCCLKAIENFGGREIPFAAITVDWLRKFEKHLLKLGRTYTTVGMRCRALRCIMNDAKRLGIIKETQYPFGRGKYDIPTGEGRKMAVSLSVIKQISEYEDGSEYTACDRDLWFFSYLCNGANFADLLRLKYSDIQDDEISFKRSKTIRTSKVKKEIRVIITPEMQSIMDRWGNKDRKANNYIFQFLKGEESPVDAAKVVHNAVRRCNKTMKKIAQDLGVGKISTYTARHSYATVLKRSGANIAYISESLGHSDLKTTETYLASFEKGERERNANLLTNFDDKD